MQALRWAMLLFFCCLASAKTEAQQTEDRPTTFILMRHAEKADEGGDNPKLSEEGYFRAVQLAYTLREQPITAIFSTEYLRTVQTVTPLANFHGLEIQRYSAVYQEEFLKQLLERYSGQTVVIVGHSNNIPVLVSMLSGRQFSLIEHYVYNDLFIVTANKIGKGEVLQLKYGNYSAPPIVVSVDEEGVALGGYDVVSYFADNQAVKGNRYLSVPYQGATYYFSSTKNLRLFVQNSGAYLPQYGGWCALAVANSDETELLKRPADPESFLIFNQKLYLFEKNKKYDARALWEKSDAQKLIQQANSYFR